MIFKRIKQWVLRLFDRTHNEIALGKGSECEIPSDADVTETSIRIHGKSRLIVSKGARISHTRFQIDGKSTVFIGPGCVLDHLDICLWNNSSLKLGEDCQVSKVHFILDKGIVTVGPMNVISQGDYLITPTVRTSDGELVIADHNNLSCSFWIRFGGKTVIGRYNCINNGTDIRCDESVGIGSYNMISYNCDIWDTNTHCFYSLEKKKEMFEKDFPLIGKEQNKPNTKPVIIGNGNWIGKGACILKNCIIGDEVTIGTRSVLSNITVEDGKTVVPSKSVMA